MNNAYRINGPTVISVSGGRTSAYMLAEVVKENGQNINAVYAFCNTGKEREETLVFVRDVGAHFGVNIVWLEYGRGVVSFETASRNGEPFERLITAKSFLPNPVMRFCTSELKVLVIRDHMRGLGYDDSAWTNMIGIRADEPARVARIGERVGGAWETVMPLARSGVVKADVLAFWRAMPFDLQLKAWEGNCDLCFLKGASIRARMIRDDPASADWWISMEEKIGARFRKDQRSYSHMKASVFAQPLLPIFGQDEPDDAIDCFCGDGQ